jgi:hypothetical protein
MQQSAVARVFKKAIASDGVTTSDFEGEEKTALEKIWRNGWLHEKTSNNDPRYVFPSKIHRW